MPPTPPTALTTSKTALIDACKSSESQRVRHTSICNEKERCLSAGYIIIEKPLKCSNVLSIEILKLDSQAKVHTIHWNQKTKKSKLPPCTHHLAPCKS